MNFREKWALRPLEKAGLPLSAEGGTAVAAPPCARGGSRHGAAGPSGRPAPSPADSATSMLLRDAYRGAGYWGSGAWGAG